MKIGLVLAAIGADFGLGWLLTWWVGGRAVGLSHFSIWVSGGLAVLWAPFYWFCWRRFQTAFWPILLFPNPFVAFCSVLTLACATGGGCL